MPLQYAGNPREAADQVAALEKAGLDQVWVAEPYGFDAVSLMGYLAAKTETVEIGAGILNVYSRTPGALLQTAAGLDNVSNGRAILGLGASGPQVIEGFHGVPYDKPLARTREIIEILRKGLRREALGRRDGAYVLAGSRPASNNGEAVFSRMVDTLVSTGIGRRDSFIVLQVLGRFAVGWVLYEQSTERPLSSSEAGFEFGLQALLDGIENRIAAGQSLDALSA